MSAKGKSRISSRNIFIILLIVTVIAAAYILISSYSGESENVLSVGEVLDRSEELIRTQEVIKVEGYYNYFDVGIAEVTDSIELPGSTPPENRLLVDYRNVENVTLNEGEMYHFKGVLQQYVSNPNLVILVTSKIGPK